MSTTLDAIPGYDVELEAECRARVTLLRDEARAIEEWLAAWAPTPELESAGKARKTPVRVSEEAARDWFVNRTTAFRIREFTAAFGCSLPTAYHRLAWALSKDIVRPVSRGLYAYHRPSAGGPAVRPRGERRVPGVGSQSMSNGGAVPGTGLPSGPSGRPGRDRRKQAKGHTIRPRKQTGVKP